MTVEGFSARKIESTAGYYPRFPAIIYIPGSLEPNDMVVSLGVAFKRGPILILIALFSSLSQWGLVPRRCRLRDENRAMGTTKTKTNQTK